MSSNTKNIGQVVGLFISTTPPSNTTLIWYDETPNQRCHKVYNPTIKLWQALNPDIISITTYSELVNNAKKNGLSVGKKYQIRDKGGVLATVITPTKIQYVDTLGNILIDDLGTNVQYHVSSSNIFIDDVNGVLNSSNQLIFSFDDTTPNFETDYFFGKVRVGAKWVLAKFRLNKFLSKSTGNSISWKNGFFFNFSDAIKGILDKTGGIVSKSSYDKKMRELETAINNVSKENQNIVSDASKAVTDATADAAIYNKKLPINIDTTIAPGDIQRLDSLATIVSKVQRWILNFKYATGIRLSRNFAEAKNMQYINSNDTVESAFGKVQYVLKNPNSSFTLPSSWTDSEYTNAEMVEAEDDYNTIFSKLSGFVRNAINTIRLSSDLAKTKYNSIISVKHLYDTNGKLVDMLSQLDYNQHHINKEMIDNNIIDYDKIASKGVLPTDVFRIDLTTNEFNFNGCSFGGIVIQSLYSKVFAEDEYLDNPYKLYGDYYKNTNKILAFIPVIPVINGKTTGNNYGNASSFVHVEENITCQFILLIKEEIINNLQSSGKNYFKLSFSADVYGYKTSDSTRYVSIRKKIIYSINLNKSNFTSGNKPHLILFIDITPVSDTNS